MEPEAKRKFSEIIYVGFPEIIYVGFPEIIYVGFSEFFFADFPNFFCCFWKGFFADFFTSRRRMEPELLCRILCRIIFANFFLLILSHHDAEWNRY
jgi:hypothetical protein